MGSRKPTSSFDRFQCFYSWGWKCFKWSYILGKSIYDYCKDLYWLSCCIAKRLKKNGMAHFPSIPTPQSLLQVFWARRECWNFIWWSQVSIIQSTYFFLYLGKALHYFSTAFPSLQAADMRGCQEGLCSSRLSPSGKAPVPTRAGLPSQYLVFLFRSPLGPFVGSSNGHSWKWFLFLPLYHYFASKFWLLG